MKMETASFGFLLPSMLVLSSCWMVVGGQNLTCEFRSTGRAVITSAVRYDDGSPGVKVQWNTTIPSECITSVTLWSQSVGTHSINYMPTNVTQTDEITLRDLRCDTQYNLMLRVRRVGIGSAVSSNTVSVHVGVPPTPVNLTAAATANGIVVSWGWNCGLFECLYKTEVVYQLEGAQSNEMVLDLPNKSATSATLQNLQPNTQYTIYVRISGIGVTRARTENVILLLGRDVPTSVTSGGEPPSTPSTGETTSTPSTGETTSTPSGGETSSTPPDRQTTSTPSDGEISSTTSNGEPTSTPSGGERTSSPSVEGKPSSTPIGSESPSISGGETVGHEHPGETPLSSTTDEHPAISYPEHCECWPAAGGTIGTMVIVLLVIIGGLLTVIWHLKRSLNKLQEEQRTRNDTQFPMEQCSAYGKIGHTAYTTDSGLVYEVIH